MELVRGVLAAIAAGDREGALGFFDPQIVVDATRNVFNPATFVGIEGLRQMAAATDETWQQIRTEPLEFIDAGERVVVIERLVGKGKGSGVEVAQPAGQVWTIRDGRVVRWEFGYKDRSEALEAAGLRAQSDDSLRDIAHPAHLQVTNCDSSSPTADQRWFPCEVDTTAAAGRWLLG